MIDRLSDGNLLNWNSFIVEKSNLDGGMSRTVYLFCLFASDPLYRVVPPNEKHYKHINNQ